MQNPIDRAAFFAALREDPFPGRLTQGQVIGMEQFLEAWKRTPFEDLRHLAYCFGTQPIETGWTMHPVEEGGHGAGKEYGEPDPKTGHRYYGRGYVQLTWRENYERATTRLRQLGLADVDLVEQPSAATLPEIAGPIMLYGMQEGWFTGKKLADYFNESREDWKNARQIVNRMDRADEIAAHAQAFHRALLAATAEATPSPPTVEVPATPTPPSSDELQDLVQRIKQLTGAKTVRLDL